MKISILTVTQDRPEFLPWLYWNFSRLDWPEKELVIIDSSATAVAPSKRKPATFYHHAPGANVPAKRNMAMAAATGDFITWLDDDDWRHPDWAYCVAGLATETGIAGGRSAYFVDLFGDKCRVFHQRQGLLFASLMAARELATAVPFDESIERGSDLDWMARLLNGRGYQFTYEAASLFLCHDRNMGNQRFSHYFNRPRAEIANTQAVGPYAWGDTDDQIAALAKRLKNGN